MGEPQVDSRRGARARARVRHPGKNLTEYLCPVSEGWHIGNLPAGGRDEARRIQAYKAVKARSSNLVEEL